MQTKLPKGTKYYFFRGGTEYSEKFLTRATAMSDGLPWVKLRMQSHIPHFTLREAVVGTRGSTILDHFYANCAR